MSKATGCRRSLSALALLVVLSLPLSAQAAGDSTTPDSAHSQLRFVTGQDPTMALSQFQPYVEWNALPQGVERWTITPNGVYAFNDHLQVLGQLPFVVQSAGDVPGGESESGLGDLYLQPTYTFAFHKGKSRIRGLVGAGISANTGQADLGDGAWVLSPQVGVSIPIGKRVSLITVVGYQFSFAEDTGVPATDNVITSEFFIFHLPDYWYSILQVNPVYIGADSKWTNVVTLQAGKFFGERHRIGPSVLVSVNSGTKTSVYPYSTQVQVAMNWLYPKGQASGSR